MNSILKLLEYIRKVSREEIVVDGKKLDVPEKVVLRPSFFKLDSCQCCSLCCSGGFNTAFTQSGLEFVKNCPEDEFNNKKMYGDNPIPLENREILLDSIVEHVYNVNGREVKMFESPCLTGADANKIELPHKPNATSRCRWVMTDVPGIYRCGIHPVRSVTCGLPHCRFNFNSKSRTTSIGLGQFGRNWRLGCPVDLNTENSYESTRTRIYWLNKLKECAQDLGIKTYIPEILEYLESIDKDMKSGLFPSEPIVFTSDGIKVTDTLELNHKRLFRSRYV